MAQGQSPFQWVSLKVIKFYQHFISPVLGPRCRFYPSCSEYARQAIIEHGFFSGSRLALKRIIKCQPLCAGGVDPVPPKKRKL